MATNEFPPAPQGFCPPDLASGNLPDISVIMPLYNSAAHVEAAVASILAQTFANFELLVVDDGSTDESPRIVSAFNDPRIQLFERGKLGGPAAARNLGLAHAKGRYIAFFDSDDIARPSMLAELHGFLREHPEFRIVGGWVETIDTSGVCIAKARGYQDKAEKLAATMLFRNCLPTSTLFMDRRCLEQQEFDVTLTLASDYDLWARLVIEHAASILPRTLGQYRWHPQNISNQKRQFGEECLNRIFSRQLARLGVDASQEELRLHASLAQLTLGTPRTTVLSAEAWLLKLADANSRANLYPQKAFHETLADQWFAVCHSAGCHGVWTWWKFIGSPLAKWASFTPQEYYSVLRLSIRGGIKKLINPSPEHP